MSAMMQVLFTFTYFFVCCEFGERVTNEFNQFYEKLCTYDWYSFSIKMQRIYLTTLTGTQESCVIQGYANIVCTREAYKQVITNSSLEKKIRHFWIQFGTNFINYFVCRRWKVDSHTLLCFVESIEKQLFNTLHSINISFQSKSMHQKATFENLKFNGKK